MCRSEESYHQYSGCRLIQTVSAPSIHSDQDETEQKPETGVFIIFSEFIRRYASNLQNAGEGSSDEKDDAIQDYPEPHTVKVIFIIQCETAEINESLHPDRLKRRCRELRSLEEQRDSVMEERPRLTTMNTACPVCEAIERAEQQALVQEKIHPRNSTMLKPPEPRRPSNNGRRGDGSRKNPYRDSSFDVGQGRRPNRGNSTRKKDKSRKKGARHKKDCQIM